MNLSFSTLVCPAWSLGQIIDAARSNQLAGVVFRGLQEEIDVTRLPAFTSELSATLQAFRSAGLSIPCYYTSVTLVSPVPQRWQMMLDECRRYALLAQRSGTPCLRIFGGGVPHGMSRPEALMMAQRHLRQVVKLCRMHDCRPLIESHDDWSTSAPLLELLDGTDPADAGILWDLEHASRAGEAPADTARQVQKYLGHVNIKDSAMVDGAHIPRLIGEGTVPLKDCFAALKSNGYDGWLCLETEKRWNQHAPEPEQSIPHFARYVRAAW